MHEFSLARSILEIAHNAIARNGGGHLSVVTIEAGEASGVEHDALLTALESLTLNTENQGVRFVIHCPALRLKCNACQTAYEADFIYTPCPTCGSFSHQVLSGNELRVVSVESEE